MSRRLVALALVAVAASVFIAPPAHATDSCSSNSGIVTISSGAGIYDTESGNATALVARQNEGMLEFWMYDTAGAEPMLLSCGSPSVSGTTTVNATLTNAMSTWMALDMSGGRFGPSSATTIVFNIDEPPVGGQLDVYGRPEANVITVGTGGINLDGNTTVDVAVDGPYGGLLYGGDAVDVLSFGGGRGTGAAFGSGSFASGGGGNDTLRGSTNDDFLAGGPGNDAVYGGAGSDRLGEAANFIDGEGGNDSLFGEGGNDTINGGLGTDVVNGGTGKDGMNGGGGVDTVSYAAATAGVRVTLDGSPNDGTFVNSVSEQDDVGTDVENVIGSPFADRLSGVTGTSNIRNVLTGGKGNDLLNGLDGGDVLNGGPGTNTYNGGPGNDQMNGGGERDVMSGGPGGDVGKGGAGNDSLSGNDGLDVLYGQDGNDTLNGGPQIDTCYGGAGTNTMNGCEKP